MKSFKETLNLEEEMSWKVEVEGLPPMYMNGRSAGEVKTKLRKVLKNPGDAINDITRVTATEIKKDFRLRLTDKNDLEGKPVEDDEMNEAKDPNEYDKEGQMAKTQLRGVVKDASHMIEMFGDDDNLPEWVQNKITKAADYLKSAHDYMMNVEDTKEGYSPDLDPDVQKNRRIADADKKKLGAIAQMMAREKEKQKEKRQRMAQAKK